MRGDLALQPQPFAVGREQQLDRGRAEADAVVQAADAVPRVDPLDRHHRDQDLRLGHRGRIAGEQRLDVERPVGRDDEIDPVAGDVDPGHRLDDRVDLRHHDAVLEGGRLHDGRRVLGVGPRVEVPVAVGGHAGDQGDVGRQVDEVAGEQLQVGVHGPELDLAAVEHPGDARALRAGIRVVEPLGDALLEHVEMLGQHDARLDHVQVVDLRRVAGAEAAGEAVGLLLVVALQADPVAGPKDRLQQVHDRLGRHDLSRRMGAAGRDARVAGSPVPAPIGHPSLPPPPHRRR